MGQPQARDIQFSNIPDEMKNARRWVLWRFEQKGDKWTKVPYRPNNAKASSTDSKTWSSYDDVVGAYFRGGFAGLGFVLGDDGDRNWLGVDFDRVYDGGWTHDEWRGLAESMGTYMELSPSGTGVHVIGWGNKLNGRCKRSSDEGDIEVYDRGRYFTVTGEALVHSGVSPIPQPAIQALEEALKGDAVDSGHTRLNDVQRRMMPPQSEIVEMIRHSAQGSKFDSLMAGDLSGYPSRSEAVYALIGIVNWWTRDVAMTHAIVSQSSVVDDKKWRRLGFGEVQEQMNSAVYTDDPPWMQTDLSSLVQELGVQVERKEVIDNKMMKLRMNLPDDHFICRYVRHWSDVNDAYPDYHYATALALLSAGANRVLSIRTKNLGDIRTNLWFMLLGKSSFARKSTAVKPGVQFAKMCDELQPLPGTFSPEALLESLSDNEKAYHFKDEAAQILVGLNHKSYMADLRDLFCQLYDGSPFSRMLRSKKGEQTRFDADEPYLTLEWATTPENFFKTTTSIDSTSGFLLRFLPVYPQYPKRTMGIELGTQDVDFKEIALRNEYAELVEAVNEYSVINMLPSVGAMERYNAWFIAKQQVYERCGEECGLHLSVLARYVPMVLKIAALLTMGSAGFRWMIRTDEHSRVTADIPDWAMDEATRMVDEYFIPTQISLMTTVETRGAENTQERILGVLRDNGGEMATSGLLRRTRLKSKELKEAIDALEEAGDVTVHKHESEGRGRPSFLIRLS